MLWTTLKKQHGLTRAHFERREGSQNQAILYCKKGLQSHAEWTKLGEHGPHFGDSADIFESGIPGASGSGTRTDLTHIVELVKSGSTNWEIAEEDANAFFRCVKGINELRNTMPRDTMRSTPRRIVFHIGKPGTGKTYSAKTTEYGCNSSVLYELPIGSNGKWWDNYTTQKVVLLDEFEGNMPLNDLLKVLDPWQIRQHPMKGSHVWIDPEEIHVTSNNHPSLWYDYKEGIRGVNRLDKEQALRRRVTLIRYYHSSTRVDNHDTYDAIHRFWPIVGDQPFLSDLPLDSYIILKTPEESKPYHENGDTNIFNNNFWLDNLQLAKENGDWQEENLAHNNAMSQEWDRDFINIEQM